MEASKQFVHSAIENTKLVTSNVFSKSVHSRIYQSFHLQNSNLYQGRQYDSQYKSGFPRLYAFDSAVQNSVDQKNKFSFRNSRTVKQNSALLQQNSWLKSQVSRLTTLVQSSVTRSEYQRVVSIVSSHESQISRITQLLEVERRNRGQVDRLNLLLAQRDAQIRALRQRISVLQRQGFQNQQSQQSSEWQFRFRESQTIISQLRERISGLERQAGSQNQSNEWQLRYQESQTIINQLNVKITTLTQQITQQTTQINQLNVLINQYTLKISQLQRSSQVPKVDPQVGILQGKIERYQTQITQLRELISQYELQISQYQSQFTQYQTQITSLQQTNWKLQERISKQQTIAKPVQPVVAEVNQDFIVEQGRLNLRIIILLEQINRLRQKQRQLNTKSEQLHAYLLKAENYIEQIQVQLQKNNLKENVPAHIVQKVTRLEQENNKYSLLIQQLQVRLSNNVSSVGISQDDHYGQIGQRDLRIIILLEQVNRLNQKIVQIRGYLQKAEDYIEQLQYTLQNRQTQTIIPAEVQNQITYLTEQNHRLNIVIEDYITQIKNLRVSITQLEQRTTVNNTQVKIQYRTPQDVESRLLILSQQNDRLNRLVLELQNRPARVETKVQYKTEYKSDPLLQSQYAKLQLKTIVLLEEINRLNHSLKQVTSYLVNAQNFIQQLQIRINQQSHTQQVITQEVFVIPPEVQARLALLAAENQRLNRLIAQLNSRQTRVETKYQTKVQYRNSPQIQNRVSLLTTEVERLNRFIAQLNSRPPRVQTKYQSKIQYRIPQQIQAELARFTLRTIFLLEQINRLNHVSKQIHDHLVNAQNYIFECESRLTESLEKTTTINNTTIQYKVPVEVESQLAFLAQQLERVSRLNVELQNRPARIQTRVQHKVQYKISPEIETQLVALTNENQRLRTEVSRTSTTVIRDQSLELEYGKLQLRSLFLLEEINRLNFLTQQIRQQLITAENYIYEMENRPSGTTSPQILSQLAFLTQQNQRLIGQINKITIKYEQQINHYKTEITSYTTQINNYRLQISNYTTQINTFKTEINNYNVKISQLETRPVNVSVSKVNEQAFANLQLEWGRQHFRVIILLEQINRLNSKLSIVDGERVEVIGHLMNAQSYIQQLEVRFRQIEQSKHTQSVTNVTITGSNSAIQQQLNTQIFQLQAKNRIDVSGRDLRIIFLLQEISRLNNKQKQLISQLGGQSRLISSNEEILTLRRQKQDCEKELSQVLNHLRQAEQYIGQLMRQNEGFAAERDELIMQLNNLQHRR